MSLPSCASSLPSVGRMGGHNLSRNSLEINTALLPFHYTWVAMWSRCRGGLSTLFKLAIWGKLGCECRAPGGDVLVGVFCQLDIS